MIRQCVQQNIIEGKAIAFSSVLFWKEADWLSLNWTWWYGKQNWSRHWQVVLATTVWVKPLRWVSYILGLLQILDSFPQSTPSLTQGVQAHKAAGSEPEAKMLPAMLKEQEALLGKTSIRRYSVLATSFRSSSIPAQRWLNCKGNRFPSHSG